MIKHSYKVEGIHCPSCEILIEEKLGKEKGIKKAEVNLAKKEILIESEKEIALKNLNKMFKKNGYKFFELKPFVPRQARDISLDRAISIWLWLIPTVGIILIFLLLSKLGLGGFLNVNSQSSLLTFFIFGIMAGFSSCGALLSGIIISYPKRTLELLIGRIVGYTVLGIILGIVGQTVNIIGFNIGLVIFVSLIMTIVGLQMLGVTWAQKIKINLPKTITKKIVGRKLPIIIGLLTVFLPCGFTLLAESIAMISGNWISGMVIMLAFVLGSSIPLFLIGLSSEKLIKNQKMMGILILFFVVYNLNFQFGIIKPTLPSLDPAVAGFYNIKNEEPIELIKVSYTRFTGLSPYTITVRKGNKVRLEIEVKESEYGCMSAIMLPKLFERPQTLTAGKTLVMEFTPQNVGIYKFTCAMGLPHKGELNVIE